MSEVSPGAPGMQFGKVRLFCLLIGLVLTIQINWWLWNMALIVRGRWYESEWLPVFAGCIVLGWLCFWTECSIKEGALRGLLLTGPPYAWYAVSVVSSWLKGAADPAAHLHALATAFALGSSGPAFGMASHWFGRVIRRHSAQKPT